MPTYTSAAQGTGTTRVFTTAAGQVDTYTGGTRAGRNFNPGNIMHGTFATAHGAIGQDNAGFAIFPDSATGHAALTALLNTSSVQGRTLNAEIAIYAPPSENDTATYQANVAAAVGVPGTTLISALTVTQLAQLAASIQQQEGYQEGAVSSSTHVQELNGAANTTVTPPANAPAPAPNVIPSHNLEHQGLQTIVSTNIGSQQDSSADVPVGTFNEATDDTLDPGGNSYVVYSVDSLGIVAQENDYFSDGSSDTSTYDITNEDLEDFYQTAANGTESLETLNTGDGTPALILTGSNSDITYSSVTNMGLIELPGNLSATIDAGQFTNDGTIMVDGGSDLQLLTGLASDPTDTGTVTLASGSELQITGPVGSSEAIEFIGTGEKLLLDSSPNFSGVVYGAITGDWIEFPNVLSGGQILKFPSASSPVFQFKDVGSGQISTIQFATTENFSGSGFSIGKAPDGNFGIEIIRASACYVIGARILTSNGETCVEDLTVGASAITFHGCMKPIKWIGHRHVNCRRHLKPENVWPVRIAAGAFSDDLPHRDLWLSPDHAVFVDNVLIPIKHLINGTSIQQVPQDEVTYYHVELPQHDLLIAEGLPAESYLDTGDRSKFANGGDAIHLFPDFSTRKLDICAVWEAYGCATLVVTGPKLNTARSLVSARATLTPATTIREDHTA
jgi:hypothetical protein